METPVALHGWMSFAKEGLLEWWPAAVPQVTSQLDMRWDTCILCWRDSLFGGVLTYLCRWSGEGGKNGIALVRAMYTSTVITLGGVRVPVLGEHA